MKSVCRRFKTESSGSISVEFVIVLPLLIFGLVAGFVFYDAFKSKKHINVATNSVVDILSRRTNTLTTSELYDLNIVFDALSNSRSETRMRVTSVAQVEENADPIIAWSYGTRGQVAANTLTDLNRAVPPILVGDTIIVVETFSNWMPPIRLPGIEASVNLNSMVASRPRFSPWLHLDGTTPVFATYNPEWANPDAGYDPHNTGDMQPYGPVEGNEGTGNTDNISDLGDPGIILDPNGAGNILGGDDADGSGSIGNFDIPFQQVGLWSFDDFSDHHHDEALIQNSSQVWRDPQWRQSDRGAYDDDGGFFLDNCVPGNSIQRANNGQQNYLYIPWHQDYDLTSATMRMVFTADALPPTTNFHYDPSGSRLLDFNHGLGPSESPAWALFSRDAAGQDENGHFTSWVMGDGSIMVRYQVGNVNWGDWTTYSGTNYFLSAPAGTVIPDQNVDMQLTFDHEQSKLDLYINGDLVDSHPHVPVTLAGNREPWVLGAGMTFGNIGSYLYPNAGMFFCGTIHHFEIWEGAYSAREVDIMSCGIQPMSEEWFEYFYINSGRYPLPSEGLPMSTGSEVRCNSTVDGT